MCQTHSKRIHSKSVKCYRAYQYGLRGKLESYYKHFPLPKIGVPIAAKNRQDGKQLPFHAFRNKAQVKLWAEIAAPWDTCVIFECILSTKLHRGMWEDTDVATCTGNVLTIVREVAIVENRCLTWLRNA